MRDRLLIVYSHRDEMWARELLTFLKPFVDESRITLWSKVAHVLFAEPPENFKEALSSARVAVFLLSADFLASSLMCEPQTAPLLAAAVGDGANITWVAVSASAFEASPLMIYQATSDPSEPLDSLEPARKNVTLVETAKHIASLLEADRPGAHPRVQFRPPPLIDFETPVAKEVVAPAITSPAGEHTFVCYARDDAEFVLALASELKAAGVNVWLDQWDIPSGEDWDQEIDKALDDCRHFLIVLSPEAVNSEEVRSELRTALNGRKRIVPVLYKACRIPRRLTLIQYTDFTPAGPGRGAALKQIVRALGLKNP